MILRASGVNGWLLSFFFFFSFLCFFFFSPTFPRVDSCLCERKKRNCGIGFAGGLFENFGTHVFFKFLFSISFGFFYFSFVLYLFYYTGIIHSFLFFSFSFSLFLSFIFIFVPAGLNCWHLYCQVLYGLDRLEK